MAGGAGQQKKLSAKEKNILFFKKDPQQMQNAERICAGPLASNFGRCEELKQAKREMALGNETHTKTIAPEDFDWGKWNGGVNYWATQIDTLISVADTLLMVSNDMPGNSGQKVGAAAHKLLHAAKGVSLGIKFLGRGATAMGISTSVYSVYEAITTKPEGSDARFTAYANIGRDIMLLGIGAASGGLGLALGILNSILIAGDPDWFAKLMKNPNGELAARITQAAMKAKNSSSHSGFSFSSQSRLSEISRSFRDASPF